MKYTRRNFLQSITNAALAAAGLSVFPSAVSATAGNSLTDTADKEAFSSISPGSRILFQGDSITDAGRDRGTNEANAGLGRGYAFLASGYLRHVLADRDVQVFNRGISGNKVFQLAERWEEDCLQLKPDLLSILIGVNDYWHKLQDRYDGTVKVYKQDLQALLTRTTDTLGEVQLVIGEPFIVREGTAINDEWYPGFAEYQQAAKEIAQEFDAAFIPYQSIFDEASKRFREAGGLSSGVEENNRVQNQEETKVSSTYWTADGVHPTLAGSQLMASGWLETVKRI